LIKAEMRSAAQLLTAGNQKGGGPEALARAPRATQKR